MSRRPGKPDSLEHSTHDRSEGESTGEKNIELVAAVAKVTNLIAAGKQAELMELIKQVIADYEGEALMFVTLVGSKVQANPRKDDFPDVIQFVSDFFKKAAKKNGKNGTEVTGHPVVVPNNNSGEEFDPSAKKLAPKPSKGLSLGDNFVVRAPIPNTRAVRDTTPISPSAAYGIEHTKIVPTEHIPPASAPVKTVKPPEHISAAEVRELHKLYSEVMNVRPLSEAACSILDHVKVAFGNFGIVTTELEDAYLFASDITEYSGFPNKEVYTLGVELSDYFAPEKIRIGDAAKIRDLCQRLRVKLSAASVQAKEHAQKVTRAIKEAAKQSYEEIYDKYGLLSIANDTIEKCNLRLYEVRALRVIGTDAAFELKNIANDTHPLLQESINDFQQAISSSSPNQTLELPIILEKFHAKRTELFEHLISEFEEASKYIDPVIEDVRAHNNLKELRKPFAKQVLRKVPEQVARLQAQDSQAIQQSSWKSVVGVLVAAGVLTLGGHAIISQFVDSNNDYNPVAASSDNNEDGPEVSNQDEFIANQIQEPEQEKPEVDSIELEAEIVDIEPTQEITVTDSYDIETVQDSEVNLPNSSVGNIQNLEINADTVVELADPLTNLNQLIEVQIVTKHGDPLVIRSENGSKTGGSVLNRHTILVNPADRAYLNYGEDGTWAAYQYNGGYINAAYTNVLDESLLNPIDGSETGQLSIEEQSVDEFMQDTFKEELTQSETPTSSDPEIANLIKQAEAQIDHTQIPDILDFEDDEDDDIPIFVDDSEFVHEITDADIIDEEIILAEKDLEEVELARVDYSSNNVQRLLERRIPIRPRSEQPQPEEEDEPEEETKPEPEIQEERPKGLFSKAKRFVRGLFT